MKHPNAAPPQCHPERSVKEGNGKSQEVIKKKSKGKRVWFVTRDPVDLQTAQDVPKTSRSREDWSEAQLVCRRGRLGL